MTALVLLALLPSAAEADDRPCVMVVVGKPGMPEYAKTFDQWAHRWALAAEKSGSRLIRVNHDDVSGNDDRSHFKSSRRLPR